MIFLYFKVSYAKIFTQHAKRKNTSSFHSVIVFNDDNNRDDTLAFGSFKP